jgi:hypothetical protein
LSFGCAHELGVDRRENEFFLVAGRNGLNAAPACHRQNGVHAINGIDQFFDIFGITLPFKGDFFYVKRFTLFEKMQLKGRCEQSDFLSTTGCADRHALIAADQKDAVKRRDRGDNFFHWFLFCGYHFYISRFFDLFTHCR